MKKIVWIIMFGMFILAAGFEMNVNDQEKLYENIKSTDLSKENINSVSLSSKEEIVFMHFGETKKIHEIPSPKTEYFIYNDIEFGLKNNNVFRYFFTGNHRTSKGIGMGDSSNQVIETYGADYYVRTDTGADIIGYIDKQHGINIEFSFHEYKLTGVILKKI
ncbi:hypothetical protein [Rossellomorea sp. NS-SX7]|uniref:hypothetical protein n=1 Tax=Rossellomorea sp. NS-SX7 TaxID=3463856 RepID=UPI00405A4471